MVKGQTVCFLNDDAVGTAIMMIGFTGRVMCLTLFLQGGRVFARDSHGIGPQARDKKK